MSASRVSNVPFDSDNNDSQVGNALESSNRRVVLKAVAGSVVMIAAGASGVHGAFNAPVPVTSLSTALTNNEVFEIEQAASYEYDVRDSYGLVRSVFGGTISRTADYYGVSRKTIYQWINSENVPNLQPRQYIKAKDLESAAKHVDSVLGSRCKDYVREEFDGLSLDLVLSAGAINFDDLRFLIDKIRSESTGSSELSFAQKLEGSGYLSPYSEDDFDPMI